ncbi:MAG: ABC transporter [Lachnospiraceae bacterium]|nr:ABC transporter [Lachnospiraceae bacterium]
MFALYKKELKAYFTSMIGPVFLAILLVIIGIYFFVVNMLNMIADFSVALNAITFLVILIIPIITMRILAEENKQKTDQLLLTSPVSVGKIVAGKYLALLTLYAIDMVIICAYPMIMAKFGDAEIARSYSAILGFFLMGAAYIAIGMFISSLTESQVIAAVVSFIVMIFTYIMTSITNLLPTDHLSVWIVMGVVTIFVAIIAHGMMHNKIATGIIFVFGEAAFATIYFVKPELYDGLIGNIAGWFSVVDRYKDFSIGIMNITSLVYYISIVFVFLFLTIMRIKKKRWS